MSMLSQQIRAVLTAPIPFIIALLPLGVAMWAAFEWAYRSVLNKRRELYELSRSEVDHWKERVERTARQASEQVEALKKEKLPADVIPKLEQLTHTTGEISSQIYALGQANSAAVVAPLGNMKKDAQGVWRPKGQ